MENDYFNYIKEFILTFTSILYEAMPFIVLGAVVAGVLEEFLPQQLLTRLLPKRVLPAVMIGGVLGLVFPMCECGIVVVMRRLLRTPVIFDGRNLYEQRTMAEHGFTYYAIGRQAAGGAGQPAD